MTITADFSGAWAKTAMLKSIPAAARKQLQAWSAETVKELKVSVRDKHMKGHGPRRNTGHLWRNIGMETALTADAYSVTVGTGVQGKLAVKYAKIQDHGGTTHPTVTPRMRRWAWAMFRETDDAKYRAIALTKKAKLDVTIKPSYWFTDVIKRRETILRPMMDAGAIKAAAERMEGSGASKK